MSIQPSGSIHKKVSRLRDEQDCGSRLYDDFKEVKAGAAKALEERLNNRTHHGSTKTDQEGSQLSKSSDTSTTLPMRSQIFSTPFVPFPNRTEAHISRRQYVPRPSNVIDIGPEGRWLLVCAQAKKRPISLTQLNVCSATSDQQLFTELKQAYTSLKGRMARLFSLRAVKSIRFVQVRQSKCCLHSLCKKLNVQRRRPLG